MVENGVAGQSPWLPWLSSQPLPSPSLDQAWRGDHQVEEDVTTGLQADLHTVRQHRGIVARGCEFPLLQEVLAQKRGGPFLDQDLPGPVFNRQVAPAGQEEPGHMETNEGEIGRDKECRS